MSLYSRKMLLSLVIVLAIPYSPVEQGNYRVGLTQLSSAEISLPNHDNTNTTDRNQLTTKSKFRHFLITFDVCVCEWFFFFSTLSMTVCLLYSTFFWPRPLAWPALWWSRVMVYRGLFSSWFLSSLCTTLFRITTGEHPGNQNFRLTLFKKKKHFYLWPSSNHKGFVTTNRNSSQRSTESN